MLKDLNTNKIDKLEFFIAIENSTRYMLKKATSWRNNVPQRLFLHDSIKEARKVIYFNLDDRFKSSLTKKELNDFIDKNYKIEKFVVNSNIAQINIMPEDIR